ncbi:hypothetical protein [Nocardia altamirensis]|uniref:hypothetical protein n=1 Tax=Nocardia altamirensis TaxID=472158 RepID=UPI00083FF769|nr:hypothetical protein [Nocardia altamirensis]
MSKNRPAHYTTAQMLWAALNYAPGSTSAELAENAGIGGSTARKLLLALERTGTAHRTEGVSDGSARRPADRWWPTTDTSSGGTDTAEATEPAESGDTAPAAEDPTAPTPAANDATGGESGADTPDADNEIDSAETDPDDTNGPETATPPVEDLAPKEGDELENPTEEATQAAPGEEEPVTPKRLGKGALRGMVENFLADCAGREFTPSQLAKDLNRSAGAIHNALEKLVADGEVTRTCDAPKRYMIAPAE